MSRLVGPGGRLLHGALVLAVAAGALLAVSALARPEEYAAEDPGVDAASGGTAALPAPSDPDALALLGRAARVARSRAWTGSQVLSSAGTGAMTALIDVEHRPLMGSRLLVSSGAGGVAQTVFEADDAELGSSPLATPLGGGGAGQWESLVTASYAVRVDGTDHVAGETTDRVTLSRVDGSLAARVDVGRASGLLLQRRLYGTSGAVQRQTVFTKVAFVDAAAVAQVQPVSPGHDGAAAPVDAAGQQRLRAAGFALPPSIGPGLALLGVTSTPAAAAAARLHLSYSDGLLGLSVYEERGRLDPSTLGPGWSTATRGGTSVLVRDAGTRVAWADGGTVFTVVGDVDDDTVNRVVADLPHRGPAGGLGHRVRRGADRIGSWVDPFH